MYNPSKFYYKYFVLGVMNAVKRSLNINKLATKNMTTMSSKEALKDVIPFQWSAEVLNGNKNIIVIKGR